MKFTPRAGYVLVLPDEDQDRMESGLVLYSAGMRRKRASGWALIHNPGWYWGLCAESVQPCDDPSCHPIEMPGDLNFCKNGGACGGIIPAYLENIHVLFEKWAWKSFTLGEREFWLIPERSVFATTDKENTMNRQQLIDELNSRIVDLVKDEVASEEADVTKEEAENIQAGLDDVVDQIIEDTDGKDDEDEEKDNAGEQSEK